MTQDDRLCTIQDFTPTCSKRQHVPTRNRFVSYESFEEQDIDDANDFDNDEFDDDDDDVFQSYSTNSNKRVPKV